MWRRMLITIQFMTIFRFSDDLDETLEDMAATVGYYPLVGFFLGLLLAGCYFLLSPVASPLVVSLLIVMILAVFTQGLHLDGLSDTADGLLSHRSRERKLEIMKDSTIGVMGAVALIFVILLKIFLIYEILNAPSAWIIIILFPLWGRWACSLTACLSTYARPKGGLGQPFTDLVGLRELTISGAVALFIPFFLLGIPGLITTLAVTLAGLGGVWLWKKQIGGVTGDILGAVIELGECIGLLASSIWF